MEVKKIIDTANSHLLHGPIPISETINLEIIEVVHDVMAFEDQIRAQLRDSNGEKYQAVAPLPHVLGCKTLHEVVLRLFEVK